MGTNRISYLDIAKGIGIIFVVVGHHLSGIPALTTWIYSFHMPLFFIISGFLLSERKTIDIKRFIKKKANSLLYPYIVFSMICILWRLLLFVALKSLPEESFVVIIVKTLTTYGYHALWFLPTLFCAETITVLSEKRYERISWAICIVLLLVGIAVSYVANSIDKTSLVLYVLRYLGRVCISIFFVKLGYLLKILINIIDKYWVKIIVFLCSLGVSIILADKNVLVNVSSIIIGNPVLFLINAITGSLSVLILSNIIYHSRALEFLGKNSLIIMTLHMDITIEIAYIIISAMNISSITDNQTIISTIAVVLEMIMLVVISVFVSRKANFLLKLPLKPKGAKYE